jgi:hypothetical protein
LEPALALPLGHTALLKKVRGHSIAARRRRPH